MRQHRSVRPARAGFRGSLAVVACLAASVAVGCASDPDETGSRSASPSTRAATTASGTPMGNLAASPDAEASLGVVRWELVSIDKGPGDVVAAVALGFDASAALRTLVAVGGIEGEGLGLVVQRWSGEASDSAPPETLGGEALRVLGRELARMSDVVGSSGRPEAGLLGVRNTGLLPGASRDGGAQPLLRGSCRDMYLGGALSVAAAAAAATASLPVVGGLAAVGGFAALIDCGIAGVLLGTRCPATRTTLNALWNIGPGAVWNGPPACVGL
jgi:hypothetical protein